MAVFSVQMQALKGLSRAHIIEMARKAKEKRVRTAALKKGLHKAIMGKNSAKTKELIKKGADINAYYTKGTMLHEAAGKGKVAIATFLLNNGASIKKGVILSPNYRALTPLQWAVIKNKKEVAELLIARGADLKAKVRRKSKLGTWPKKSLVQIAPSKEMKKMIRKANKK